jgi:CheY-like chemotaxis protein
MAHTLLLADDNTMIQRVVALTFANADVDVVTVADGEQAIVQIAASRPDIVLADIGMPKRSGYDVAAFVKRDPLLRHIPVLLLAGAFDPVDAARAEQVGCDGVLVKPFEPQSMVARVRELLAGAKGNPAQSATADVPRPIERLVPRVAPPASDAIPELAPSRPPAPAAAASSDDYFNRLDAAFSSMSSPAPPPAEDDDEAPVPTLDAVLSGTSGPRSPIDDALVDEVTRRVLERLGRGGRP